MELVDWNSDFELKDGLDRILFRDNRISLSLSTKNCKRVIGKIEKKDGVLVYRKKKLTEAVHLMRKNDSWGLCWAVVDKLPDEAIILIESDKDTYYIKVKDAKENGEFLSFKEREFEKQFFVPRKYWSIKQ